MSIDLNIINNDNLRPRDEIRIERISAEPYPDRQRIKVEIEITPFRERPNLEVDIRTAEGHMVASTSVVAAMNFTLALVLHLRGVTDPTGEFTVRASLYYDDPAAVQDQKAATFTIAPLPPTEQPDV